MQQRADGNARGRARLLLSASPADAHLPSVSTCHRYLHVPEYSSFEVLCGRLRLAVAEGRGAFLLS